MSRHAKLNARKERMKAYLQHQGQETPSALPIDAAVTEDKESDSFASFRDCHAPETSDDDGLLGMCDVLHDDFDLADDISSGVHSAECCNNELDDDLDSSGSDVTTHYKHQPKDCILVPPAIPTALPTSTIAPKIELNPT